MQSTAQVAAEMGLTERAVEGWLRRLRLRLLRTKADKHAVELPDSRWRVIHHFLWQADPPVRGGTEYIRLWPAYRLNKDGFRSEGELAGRVLYDDRGETYAGDYHSLKVENYVSNSWFFGTRADSNPFALFSLPCTGNAAGAMWPMVWSGSFPALS